MDHVRTDILLNLKAIDEFIWDEPDLRMLRLVAEKKLPPDHSSMIDSIISWEQLSA